MPHLELLKKVKRFNYQRLQTKAEHYENLKIDQKVTEGEERIVTFVRQPLQFLVNCDGLEATKTRHKVYSLLYNVNFPPL